VSTNQEFREAIGGLFREMAVAVNEIAGACKENELRERFFAFKRCFERGVVLCTSTEPKPRGEEAPEFAAEKGESVRIVEL
jgi:hypothetical protein